MRTPRRTPNAAIRIPMRAKGMIRDSVPFRGTSITGVVYGHGSIPSSDGSRASRAAELGGMGNTKRTGMAEAAGLGILPPRVLRIDRRDSAVADLRSPATAECNAWTRRPPPEASRQLTGGSQPFVRGALRANRVPVQEPARQAVPPPDALQAIIS